jgi:hypothetical protein
MRRIVAIVAAFGLRTLALADATLPSAPQPATDEDADGRSDAEPPIECGSAYARQLQRALAAYCAKTSDESDRVPCRYLLRGFRRCKRSLTFGHGNDGLPYVTVAVPVKGDEDPTYATAIYGRAARGYKVDELKLWEDCP